MLTRAKRPVEQAPDEKARALGRRTRHGRWHWRAVVERYAVLIILGIVLVVFSVLEPTTFATKTDFTSILQENTVLACLCLGLLFPLAVGEFDLSVGYVLGFAAVEGAALRG